MAGKNPIDVTVHDDALNEVRKRLSDMEKRAPSVMAQSLNQTQTVLKKHLPEQTLQKYTYNRKLQKPRQQRASYRKLSATLYYDRKDPGLQHFDFKPGTKGTPLTSPGARLAVRVRSDGGFKDIGRAFFNSNAPKLNGGIFRRDESARFPISKRFGPSEHSMIRNVWHDAETQEFTTKTLGEKLDDQINAQFLKKWGMSGKEAKSYLAGK